ncbi:hypothetical protein A3H10_03860 [Candidatus Uhrbacteria bacterium RIFCSPLOWO2_12_FULL_46_10]|uniref:Uncharacterized protein n=1 Tax=Candidatus Uhrbacteria bacterium RIFCSPLOWO2_01_FULL_47_25 TaxID=1802402 RepID=A0A1F7URV5_9BACT|nr:MAG: RNA polymerase sigma-70 factor, ECF subfamily [Parcubacteria group bacterium GW2011_GWA2_46_9]OGL60623.1 MAG: hypothetical protein A2752_02235 [Candidatus Uhrbacteria bacterium RIFCSPHIGHO2_01_FULL_46_23]OGL68138.1 MAG: hypothetical protein A3D60_04000 [Candidatus Uhrbacteria bacterium RIFCSPHIGHO2_02_FULL_47_29]OGL74817.1 MAG: hypothetical protein A3E96_04685 [Candidatus Uhrbacteria bacterium RIFCSPHIGHO2_12_FULL_46_13]OGL80989.1 MAG: hypothetical protein A2936_03335 [Candidatus Uhrbac
MQTPWHEKLLLYRLYRDRDPDAFGELYDRYAPKIYRYVYFKVSTTTEAEDLTAEVFLKTWEYVQRHADNPEKRIENFRAFIYRLAKNAVVDHYRQRREASILAEDSVLEKVSMPEEMSAVAKVTLASDMATVEIALKGLKDEYRELLILKYIEGYATHEIAKILEKQKGAVRVGIHRALAALREEIEKIENK